MAGQVVSHESGSARPVFGRTGIPLVGLSVTEESPSPGGSVPQGPSLPLNYYHALFLLYVNIGVAII